MTFPTSLNEKDEALRAEVYWEEFKRVGIDEFEYGVSECIGSVSFFPKPTELWEVIRRERHQEYLSHQASMPELPRIEWMEPTEEGKRIASGMMGGLFAKWKQEDELNEKKRQEEFEKKRAILKKQAKLLVKER